jgi:hypothetical protein
MIPIIIIIACAVYLGTRDWKVVYIPPVLWGIFKTVELVTSSQENTMLAFIAVLCCLALIGIFDGVLNAIVGTFKVLCGLAVVAILFW